MMTIIQAKSENDLTLGRQGENLARQVVFDLSAWEAEYGPGVAELIHQRPGDAAPYPVAAVREGGTLVWTLTSADTDFHSDYGSCELRYYVGDVLVKSRTWLTKVIRAMSTPSETAPPEPEQGWVDQIISVGAAAKASADAAKADADRATALAAEVSKKAAQTAQDASDATKAMEAAQTAQRLAEEAQSAAEAARTAAAAAQSAAEKAATDAAGAKQDVETALKSAQDAAAAAAKALADIRTLYQEMQTWAQGVIQDVNDAGSAAVQSVQSAGDAQVQRVTEEGTRQTANAKAQADAAAQSAADAAQSAQQAAESAAVYDTVVADVTQLKQDLSNLFSYGLEAEVSGNTNTWYQFKFEIGKTYVYKNTSSSGKQQPAIVSSNGSASVIEYLKTGADVYAGESVKYSPIQSASWLWVYAASAGGFEIYCEETIAKNTEIANEALKKANKVPNLENKQNSLITAVGLYENIANPDDKIDGGIWSQVNTIYNADGYSRIEIAVEPNKNYTVGKFTSAFCWFTNDANVNLGHITTNRFTTPDGCTKIRLGKGGTDNFVLLDTDYDGIINGYSDFPYGVVFSRVARKDDVIQFTGLSMFDSIAVIGDSFASGGIYIDEQTNWGTHYDLSWPTVIQRRIGCTVNNYSISSISTRTWLTHANGLTKALSDNASGLYMLCLGINDNGMENYLGAISDIHDDWNDNADTFYGNYGKIFDQLKAHAPNSKFVFVIPPYSYLKDGFRQAILDIASHYGVPILYSDDDFFKSSFFNDNFRTGHPVAMTYAGMAMAYDREMDKCIRNNAEYFIDYHGTSN